MSRKEKALEEACLRAARLLKGDCIIGLGSGSTMAIFTRVLGRYAKSKGLKVKAIPSSLQIQAAAEEAGMELAPITKLPQLAWAFDGADQVDAKGRMIKGGGGALMRERILLKAAKRAIIIIEESKKKGSLDAPIPLEVLPFALSHVRLALQRLGGEPKLRVLEKGYPYITENGNLIIDVSFGTIKEPEELRLRLKEIPGVLEVGLFTDCVKAIYVAGEKVEVLRPSGP